MQTCPFCGAPETDRIDFDGRRTVVFRCMFSPTVDPAWSEETLDQHLRATYGAAGDAYFRGMCDRLHLFVVQGRGARELLRPVRPPQARGG